MRIVMVVPTLSARGGAERVVSVLSQHLARSHDVVVAVFQLVEPAFPCGGEVVDLGYPPSNVPWMKPVNGAGRVRALARLFTRIEPDLVLSFMESANFPSVLSALLVNRLDRVTVSVRDNPAAFPEVYRSLMRVLYPRAARVVVGSNALRERLVRDFGFADQLCVTIPNPIDLERIKAMLDTSRDRFVPPADPYLVAVGRLVRQKGFDLAIEAYSRLPAAAPSMVILGEGPERGALEAQVREKGLSGRVLLPGAVDNVYPYLAHARCFVLSSRHEGWPNVLIEAMACACPIVAFDCDFGPGEILEHEKGGLLVPPGDVAALARALERVLEDDALRLRLAESGRARVEAFAVERVAGAWLA